eukprot:7677115-Pyramimonas_sp.AAC.1
MAHLHVNFGLRRPSPGPSRGSCGTARASRTGGGSGTAAGRAPPSRTARGPPLRWSGRARP